MSLASKYQELLSTLSKTRDDEAMTLRNSHDDDLNAYSIFHAIPEGTKQAFVQEAIQQSPVLDRIVGSMCGMGVGDMLGHPFEFEPAQDEPRAGYFDLETFKFHGEANQFRLKRGQWTDDASMGLCMADSLIMLRTYDGSDMRIRFWNWWNRGYNNAFRKDNERSSSVGLGGNISKSLSAITRLRGQKPPPKYEAQGEDAGNGSLMRLTPVPLFFHCSDMEQVHHYARMSSYTTHPGIIAAEACSLLSHLIVRAVNRPEGPVDPKAFLEKYTREYYDMCGLDSKSGWGYDQMKCLVLGKPENATEACWAWRSEKQNIEATLKARGRTYNGYPVSAGYFGSYSLDGLALALWAVYNTTSFDEAVVRSVNLFGDADSHGSITGQLAGALYGYKNIHPKFMQWLNTWDDHEFGTRAVMLYYLGHERQEQMNRTGHADMAVDKANAPGTQ
eukprot:TRINITY_DN12189_c0_g2_i2.p1 TRINITY_DN12189_c0_g2~~TRINITY_DN12189_c0_g2_i2.p1  ORF type:complete len:446 (+),score=75.68 TRINITY_DN12189_c0_g2_i2:90-1427(+)